MRALRCPGKQLKTGGCDGRTRRTETYFSSSRRPLPAIFSVFLRVHALRHRCSSGAARVQKVLNVPISKFAPNIAAKGLPFAEALAFLTYFAESAAAACLAIGLFTRIAAAMIGIEMLVIVFAFQWQFGYFWTARGYEYALLWLLLCIAIFFKGGGRYSIDRIIGKEF
jgi:putative oxidoreductase